MEDKSSVSGGSQYPFVSQESSPYESSGSKKWFWILLFFSGAVTAGLVCVSVLGSMYLQDIKGRCAQPIDSGPNPQAKVYNLTSNGGDVVDTYKIDLDAKRVSIKQTTSGKGETSEVVIDYRTNTAGVYDKERNMCYLVGGLSPDLPDPTQLQQAMDTQDKDLTQFMKIHESYTLQHDRPVRDMSVVPNGLRDVCVGRPVYWTIPDSGSSEEVNARGGSICLIWGIFGLCLKWD